MLSPCSSAAFFTRFKPITQFLIASSSAMPLRLPKKAMRFGHPRLLGARHRVDEAVHDRVVVLRDR